MQEDLFGNVHKASVRGEQADLFACGGISADSVIRDQRRRIDTARAEMENQRRARQIPGQVDLVDAVAEVEEEAEEATQGQAAGLPVVRVAGFNDEQTNCDRCGRMELRGTVILIDEHGEIGRYGTTCAGYMLPGEQKVTRQQAKTVEMVRESHFWDSLRRARRRLDQEKDFCGAWRTACDLLRVNGMNSRNVTVVALWGKEIDAAEKLRRDSLAVREDVLAERSGHAR